MAEIQLVEYEHGVCKVKRRFEDIHLWALRWRNTKHASLRDDYIKRTNKGEIRRYSNVNAD